MANHNLLKSHQVNRGVTGGNAFVSSTKISTGLVAIQCLNILSLTVELANWFIALAAICLIWHLCVCHRLINAPTKAVKLFVAISGCVLLIVSGKQLGLLIGMIHLLCFAYLLKPFELTSKADSYQLVVLGLLILATSLIFQQSIYFAFAVLVMVVINFCWLSCLFISEPKLKVQLYLNAKILLQSIPLAIVLFVVFPKISPLWQMPVANSATTGLNDTVAVGDISQLALSNELAFRVEFINEAPDYDALYWRALVLERFDGTHWRKERDSRFKPTQMDKRRLNELVKNKQSFDYHVIAEPSFQNWLFALDIAKLRGVKQQKSVLQLADYTLYSQEKVAHRLGYSVSSYPQVGLTIDKQTHDKTHVNLLIDDRSNPKLSHYAKQLKQQFGTNSQALIQSVLETFRQEAYRYTLTPPPLVNHSLDQFFFDTRAGFCEHYASSFAYLMRVAGIPARLVLGYLGGEYNEQGGYYSIYQRDAHAWTEVWLDNQGWVRVDPTAYVDPSRVERGFSDILRQEREASSQGVNLLSVKWLTSFRMQLDALDYQWTKVVINYSQKQQNQLLGDWFGGKRHITIAFIIILSIVAIAILTILWLKAKRPYQKRKKWQVYFDEAQKLLAKKGIIKQHHMTFSDFKQTLLQQKREIGELYSVILDDYQKLHYQSLPKSAQIALVKQMKHNLNKLKQL